jgi:hypothetical protein
MRRRAEPRDQCGVTLIGLRSRKFALAERLDPERNHNAYDVTMCAQIRRQLLAPTTG